MPGETEGVLGDLKIRDNCLGPAGQCRPSKSFGVMVSKGLSKARQAGIVRRNEEMHVAAGPTREREMEKSSRGGFPPQIQPPTGEIGRAHV